MGDADQSFPQLNQWFLGSCEPTTPMKLRDSTQTKARNRQQMAHEDHLGKASEGGFGRLLFSLPWFVRSCQAARKRERPGWLRAEDVLRIFVETI